MPRNGRKRKSGPDSGPPPEVGVLCDDNADVADVILDELHVAINIILLSVFPPDGLFQAWDFHHRIPIVSAPPELVLFDYPLLRQFAITY